jgi:hypothetical protein
MSTPSEQDRRRRLRAVIEHYGIEPSYAPAITGEHLYVAVSEAVVEGEQPAAAVFDTTEAACAWLASAFDPDYPREPVVVIDLDTGDAYKPVVKVEVTLAAGLSDLRLV